MSEQRRCSRRQDACSPSSEQTLLRPAGGAGLHCRVRPAAAPRPPPVCLLRGFTQCVFANPRRLFLSETGSFTTVPKQTPSDKRNHTTPWFTSELRTAVARAEPAGRTPWRSVSRRLVMTVKAGPPHDPQRGGALGKSARTRLTVCSAGRPPLTGTFRSEEDMQLRCVCV